MVVYVGNQRVSFGIVSKVQPTGTISITSNGTHDVTNYASADVNVSGGGSSTTGFLVQVIDYDGTVLKSERLDTGATFILPSQPSHTGLVFQSWSSPVTITNNTVTVTNSDIIIGATYTTASGLSEFDITLTKATGLSVTLNMNGTKNWGDGTSDTNTTHTYANTGDYTITCDGSTMNTTTSRGLFGQTSSVKNYYAKDIRFGNSITSIAYCAFQHCYSLTSITIPSSVTSIDSSAFTTCYSLVSIVIPKNVTSIGNGAFNNCRSLTSIIIPSSVTSTGGSVFFFCSSLVSVIIPEGITSIVTSTLQNCYSLTSITIPSSVTSIDGQALSFCCSLTSIKVPSSVTSIGNGAFSNCYSILEYDFSNHTTVPTLSSTNAFSNINQICKIKVPTSLEAEWKAATNWSTYANYIVGV